MLKKLFTDLMTKDEQIETLKMRVGELQTEVMMLRVKLSQTYSNRQLNPSERVTAPMIKPATKPTHPNSLDEKA